MKNSKLYCCYSVPLMKFICSKGIKYEIVAKNPNTEKTFWVYIRDEKLDTVLSEWGK